MKLCDAATMREMDHQAIHHFGIPGVVLMEHAGKGTVEHMKTVFGAHLRGGVTVLCGRGNNGGDGFVIARLLHNEGIPVKVYLFCPLTSLQGDAALNARIAIRLGILVLEVNDADHWRQLRTQALSPELVVDALLGTGLNTEVVGLYRLAIEDLNAANKKVISVDIPSGLDASSGRPHGIAARATLTCTYGLAKLGLFQDPALPYVGEVQVVDISLPGVLLRGEHLRDRLMTEQAARRLLPARPVWGHKGTFGHVGIVAGSAGKGGAAVLAAHGALRAGAGLVTLLVPESTLPTLAGLWPEVMVECLPDDGEGRLTLDLLPVLQAQLQGKTAVAIGPGLSQHPPVGEVVRALLANLTVPVVLDADGLNVLGTELEWLQTVQARLVLTPHPGEAGRLLGLSTAEVIHDRPAAARALAQKTRAMVVLKGARSLIVHPEGHLTVNGTGSPAMAKAGSGDVLTGLMVGLLSQGLDPEPAAQLGVYLHGRAGELAAREKGKWSPVASDLLTWVGQAFQTLEVVEL